jgi:hypothetical protein
VIQSDSLLEYVDEIATSAPLGVVCILGVGLGRFEDLIRWTSLRRLQPWKSRQHLVRHATVTGPGGMDQYSLGNRNEYCTFFLW